MSEPQPRVQTGHFQTRAQREWRPGMPKKRRSTAVMFGSTVLGLEGFVAFFATLVVFGLRSRDLSGPVVLSVGIVLSLVLIGACAVLTRPWGRWLGWILQLVLIAVGFMEPMMFVIGPLFALAWWYALTAGSRIDRDNAERDRQQALWEKEQPTQSDDGQSDDDQPGDPLH
ncbi:DUF4233 domain-containing protein [Psychromicrobium xiongbiense]|uniref:DUF4233 domain-containing protein n=1 Tax=Psychromicrobium xiongbiense TaxID=3051184 RepID=UPI002553D4D6|nr:DUF4233 domain-containing protein [Psychromicrobium sp. YIM S02556]